MGRFKSSWSEVVVVLFCSVGLSMISILRVCLVACGVFWALAYWAKLGLVEGLVCVVGSVYALPILIPIHHSYQYRYMNTS